VALQVVSIYAGTKGHLDELDIAQVGKFEADLHEWVTDKKPDLLEAIRTARKKPDVKALNGKLEEALKDFKRTWKA